jgi:hypothetical protein
MAEERRGARDSGRTPGRSNSRYGGHRHRVLMRWVPVEKGEDDAQPRKDTTSRAVSETASEPRFLSHMDVASPPNIAKACRDWTTAIKDVPVGFAEGFSRLASPPPNVVEEPVMPSSWGEEGISTSPPSPLVLMMEPPQHDAT